MPILSFMLLSKLIVSYIQQSQPGKIQKTNKYKEVLIDMIVALLITAANQNKDPVHYNISTILYN